MEPHSAPSFPLSLPNITDLPPQHLGFLDHHFSSHQDLSSNASNLSSSLTQQCSELDSHLQTLQNELTKRAVSWISRSFLAKSALDQLNRDMQDLGLRTSRRRYGIGSRKFHRVLCEELPRLAKEVKRIESIRCYAETALQLEALVGDLEDAALFVMACHTGNMFSKKTSSSSISTDAARKPEKLLLAIKAMNDIEEVLITVVKFHSQWHSLVRSVDNRVDKILAALRPQVFADHRALLVSLGWPPKLLPSKIGSGQITGLPNPLVLMQEDKRRSYSESFIALCALQHLQTRREERQLHFIKEKKNNIQLWAIDELVSPIASRMEYHFTSWIDQPEYIFALVYKVTGDFITGVDDVLQPLIDRARLISCSAKEAWVSAMVQMVSSFLEKRVFSLLAERYNEKHMKPETMSSWLHLIDLIVAFDKQMQSLVNLDTGLFLTESERFEGLSTVISVLTIFCNRLDWLKIWAKIEFKNAWKKLKIELIEDKAWMIDNKDKSGFGIDLESRRFILSTVEDHRVPPIAESCLKIVWEMTERCQTMPSILSRARFIRSTAGRFLWCFFKILLLRMKTTELHPDDPDDDAIVRVCGLINAARYIEAKLREWSDTVEYLEMKIAENDSSKPIEDDIMNTGSFYGEEIRSLSEMEINWLMEIIAVILRQFEMISCEYVKKKDNFEREQDDKSVVGVTEVIDLVVSVDFAYALDALKSLLHVVRINLNAKDFSDLWRSIAEGLDHYICCKFATREIRFSGMGINQFETDMQGLLFVFQPFCARPQAFFPRIKEILKILKLKKEEVKQLQAFLHDGENRKRCLHLHGISNLSVNQVVQVLRNRTFASALK
ncbi:RINT1-like protein MAG2L isoform X1 [Senna tora]|uniref:RINT1-like protein MAG2L isoform X1 n=1 Tax=Senna tora TaxID=362788 RepID=A0A834WVR6_9FABA|nr:RINT1-like protein MAG2L isoform X1 [Senna tora]